MILKIERLKTFFGGNGEHLAYIAVTVFSAGVHFIFSVYVKAFVPPLDYGIYSTCLLLNTYLSYLQLGSLNAFNRDYPQLIGARKLDKAREYRNTVFTFIFLIFLLALSLTCIVAFVLGSKSALDKRYIIGFVLSALLSFVTILENFGSYRARIDLDFVVVSKVSLIELVAVPVGIVFVRLWGWYAIIFTSILSMAIGICSYYKNTFSDLKISIDRQLLKSILVSGSPLLINGLIWTVVNSIDKFVILGFIDTEALGVYGIAQNAFNYMVLIPTALSQLLYARMGRQFGSNNNVEELNSTCAKYTAYVASVSSFVALLAFFFLPILVRTLLPNYVNGISAAQFLIIGLALYAPSLMNVNVLTILKKNAAIIENSLLVCFFNITFSIIFVHFIGAYIECVAAGTVLAYILRAIITTIQLRKYANCRVSPMIRSSLIPVTCTLLPAIVVYLLIENKVLGFFLSLLVCVVVNGLFLKTEIVEKKQQ